VLTFLLLVLALACAVVAILYWASAHLDRFRGFADALERLHVIATGAVVAGFLLATAALVRRERWPLFVMLAAAILAGAACLWLMGLFH